MEQSLKKSAAVEYRRLIKEAKNKDAALSAFDRNHYAGKYGVVNGELATAIAEKFKTIRDARFQKRHRQDIGKVTNPTQIEFTVINEAVKKCEEVLQWPEANQLAVVLACLLLVTGRRTAEVTGTTEFTLKWFRGTVKSQGVTLGRANYLVPFRYINNGLKYLEANGWRGLSPKDANKKCAVPLHRIVKSLFPFVTRAHELRAVHVAFVRYATEHKSKVLKMTDNARSQHLAGVISDQLGHSNVLSALPYLKFKIA